MRKKSSYQSTDKHYKRFDAFLKMLLLTEEFELLAFFLLQFGYILLECIRLPNELRMVDGRQREVDALFKASVQLPDGRIIEVYIIVEFQHSNDPKMADRIYTYCKAVMEVYQTEIVLPIVVYTGEYRCRMKLNSKDDPFHSFPYHIRLVDITRMVPRKFTTHLSTSVHFLAILNHLIDPEVISSLLKTDLKRMKNTKGPEEMNLWCNRLISILTKKNNEPMKSIIEIYREHPELVIHDSEGHRLFWETIITEKYQEKYDKELSVLEQKLKKAEQKVIKTAQKAKEAEQKAKETEQKAKETEKKAKEAKLVGKSEGVVEGRIESAYLMISKGGMSFEGASAILGLSEIEQEMLRQRMAKNGH